MEIKRDVINSELDSFDICPIKLMKFCVKNDINRIGTIYNLWEIKVGKKTTTTTEISEVLTAQKLGHETEHIGWEIDCN